MPTITARQDLLALISMARDGIAWCEANNEPVDPKQREVLAKYEAQLAALGNTDGHVYRTPEADGEKMNLTDRPAAGTRAANQFGEFQVHHASAKQTGFIRSLLERKDLTSLQGDITLNVERLREQVANNTVNKKAASGIIERLLRLPDLARVDAATGPGFGRTSAVQRPASEKQIGLIGRLAAERYWFDGESMEQAVTHASHAGWNVRLVLEGIPVESRDASAAIDYLFGCAKRREPVVSSLTREDAGVYVLPTGQLVRVYFGQQSGQMLAKKVTDDGMLEYAGKADRVLVAGTRRATRDEVADWGKTTGTCLHCGRALDDPESVDRGIGPVCWAKYDH